jgi:ectoine hydroxylase-related dioxygenase (phytanoyl-CoA dioxygenase family)
MTKAVLHIGDLNTSGFQIEQDVFSAKECIRFLESISDVLKKALPGIRHLMRHPTVAALASDQRLVDIATRALGSSAIPYRATLFEKSLDAKWLVVWHQDRALPLETSFDSSERGPWSQKSGITYAHAPEWALSRIVALRVHLDSSKIDNGPLRIIPKSHLAGVMTEAEVLAFAHDHEPYDCLVDRGGVLAMRPLTIHASGKVQSNEPRRVLHIEYTDSLDLAPGIHLAIA